MNYLSTQTGQSLFDKVIEVNENKKLSPLERIPKFRSVLETLFRELTRDENQFFSNLHSRETFHFSNYTSTPKKVQQEIKSLRIYANAVIHNPEVKPDQSDELVCLKALSNAISYFSNIPTPEPILELTKNVQISFKRPQIIKKETISFFAAVEDIYFPTERDKNFCVLKCDAENIGLINLFIWKKLDKGNGIDLTEIAQLAWKFCSIYVTEVRQDKEITDKYHSTDRTIVVLEPDFLIEVREIADCFQPNGSNPLIYLLNRYSRAEPSQSMILGNIANAMLDDLSIQKDYKFASTIKRTNRENALGLLFISNRNGTLDESVIKSIELSAQIQQKTLEFAKSQFSNKKINIEPTFISDKYGIQGRLDVLYEDKTNANDKNILELKGGSHPNLGIGMWKNHLMQTVLYDLLIKSVYPKRSGKSSILYSKARIDEQPLRNYPGADWYIEQQQAIMLRNKIVANEFLIASGNFEPIKKIAPETFGIAPKYSLGDIEEFGQILKNLNQLEKDYFFGFSQFVAKELQTIKVGNINQNESGVGYSSLWKKSKSEKKDDFKVFDCLKITTISDDFEIRLIPDFDLFSNQISDFRVGDSAILYPVKDPDYLNPLESQILKCTITVIDESEIIVNLINKQLDKSFFEQSKHWAIEHDLRESSYKSLFCSLFSFLKIPKERKDILFGLKRPSFIDSINPEKSRLLPNQQKIVNSSIAAKDYFLVRGYPGTGKTSLILKEIVSRLNNEKEGIVVLAFTNRAVDEICSRIAELNIDFIRLGKVKDSKSYNWNTLIESLSINELFKKVVSTNVIVSTQASFVNSLELLSLRKYKTLVVDEASQLLELQLIGIIGEFEKFILIGDDKQLPAVVVQDDVSSGCNKKSLNDIGILNYRDSLFGRLLKNAEKNKWGECYAELTDQYRMHKEIAEFVNKEYYDDKLQPVKPEQFEEIKRFSFESDDLFEKAMSISRVLFVPSRRELIRTKINDHEAHLVASFIKTIKRKYGSDFDYEKTVGVITPYRAQIANIKEKLPKELKQISVDTVERFQGSEREIIIISFAVKNESQLNLMQSMYGKVDRKLNVALTRAKSHLIILGCEDVLRKEHGFKELVDFVKSKKGVYKL